MDIGGEANMTKNEAQTQSGRPWGRSLLAGVAALCLSACAVGPERDTPQTAQPSAVSPGPGAQLASLAQSAPDIDNPEAADDALVPDPMEDWNRFVFDLNTLIYTLLQPVIAPYGVLPDARKENVDNFLHNLSTPVILVNDLLQGELDRAWVTTQRFAINSTAGGLGFWDTAEGMGLPPHQEDFGQTLGAWGVGDGPYMVYPLFGPGNPRDGVGRTVDMVTNPLFWLAGPTGERMANVHTYATVSSQLGGRGQQLESLRETSIDFYAAVRSLYVQSRRAAVANQERSAAATAPLLSEWEFSLPEENWLEEAALEETPPDEG